MADTLKDYTYRGARAMILLHDRNLREFVDTWKKARASGTSLPAVKDSDYASFDALLRHVLRAARGYMTWICKQLGLPDPGIEPTPEADRIAEAADQYLEHVLNRWMNAPLAELTEKQFYKPEYTAVWKVNYCIDAMMEHAVMHPIRHTFQLRELMGEK
ncbi:MAG: hypothetical protein ACYTG7_15980 [Planctomycetota bacterium]|jgi:uncharacterized damage-inducible protein DinB